jgi:hypothetical protein
MTNQSATTSSRTFPRKPWKKATGFVLAFVLFLGICGVFFSLDLWLGFLNKQTVVTAAAESQYSARAYEQLREDMEALMKAHSLDPEPVLALLDENQFLTTSGNRIAATLKGNTHRINTADLQWDLRDEIYRQLEMGGVPTIPEIDGVADEIVFTAGNLYDKHGYFQFGEAFMKARENSLPVVRIMFLVCLLASVALALILGFAYRRRHWGLSLINYSLFGGVIANALVVGLLYAPTPSGKRKLPFITKISSTSILRPAWCPASAFVFWV